MPREIVNIKNLSLNYEDSHRTTKIYENFNLKIFKSEKVALLGRSGSGKSTLVKFLCGILPNNAKIFGGSYFLDGNCVYKDGEYNDIKSTRGSKVAFIFQDAVDSLNPVKTIGEHFEELLLFHEICKKEEVYDIAKEKLKMLRIFDVDRVLKSYPFEQSGGMCQRICIAMSLCLNPILLIADEPTSSLDIRSADSVLENILNLDIAVLIITHDISVAARVADRIVVLNSGKICEEGKATEILKNPKQVYTKELIDSYKNIPNIKPEEIKFENKILISENLRKKYGKDEILNGINFYIYENEIFGIIGESGCGKSTLARTIMGLEDGTKGSIFYRDIDLLNIKKSDRKKLSTKIQMIFQNSRAVLNPSRTARELVIEPLMYNKLYNKDKRKKLAENLLEMVEISKNDYDARPPQLSTGQCQRVAIARALSLNPEVLIADEAVSSLDVQIQYQILKLLKDIKEEFGLSIIMISHDIRLLKNYCNRLGIMKDGVFIETFKRNEIEFVKEDYTKILLKISKNNEFNLHQ